MPPEEKPYRVYRGGRTKGQVHDASATTARARRDRGPREPRRRKLGLPKLFRRKTPGRVRWTTISLLAAVGLIVLVVAWGVAGFFSFRSGVSSANDRLGAGVAKTLKPSSGLLLSHPTTILVLGTDSSDTNGREADRHSDSIIVVRSDPAHHRFAYLSIPRDLYVSIPGVGSTKINAAFQVGGAKLAIKTIESFTGIPIQHVVVVDFSQFEKLIDAEGGITVNVPDAVQSNRFDCPYSTNARCEQWQGWRFRKGPQHMDGHQALIYSRIRENLLNPAESTDLFRSSRQQAVAQAALAKLTSVTTLLKLPFEGASLISPLATDLSATQLLQLGWVKFRSSASQDLYCRLGGDATSVGSSSVILPSEDNRSALLMWNGQSAPQLPTSTFGPGCARGHTLSATS